MSGDSFEEEAPSVLSGREAMRLIGEEPEPAESPGEESSESPAEAGGDPEPEH